MENPYSEPRRKIGKLFGRRARAAQNPRRNGAVVLAGEISGFGLTAVRIIAEFNRPILKALRTGIPPFARRAAQNLRRARASLVGEIVEIIAGNFGLIARFKRSFCLHGAPQGEKRRARSGFGGLFPVNTTNSHPPANRALFRAAFVKKVDGASDVRPTVAPGTVFTVYLRGKVGNSDFEPGFFPELRQLGGGNLVVGQGFGEGRRRGHFLYRLSFNGGQNDR